MQRSTVPVFYWAKLNGKWTAVEIVVLRAPRSATDVRVAALAIEHDLALDLDEFEEWGPRIETPTTGAAWLPAELVVLADEVASERG